jgi:hypothetical protein
MWRIVLVLGLVLAALSVWPVPRSNAGLAACLIDAVDQKLNPPLLTFNYFGYAYARCMGEDFESAQVDLTLEYYDGTKAAG